MDLRDVFRFVAPRVRDAAVKTATRLDHLGIRHALAGGLAVGAHGYVRAVAVVPIEVLIYMKLVAKRRKDQVDVIELVKAGADLKRARHYLDQHAHDLVPLFDELVNEALAE